MNPEEREKNRQIEKDLQQQKKIIEQELKVRDKKKMNESNREREKVVIAYCPVVLSFRCVFRSCYWVQAIQGKVLSSSKLS